MSDKAPDTFKETMDETLSELLEKKKANKDEIVEVEVKDNPRIVFLM